MFEKLARKVRAKAANHARSVSPQMFNTIQSFDTPISFNQERSMYKKGGYAHGGKANIASMEKSCGVKAGKNKSVTY
jgi:hypothetical protein